MIKVGQVVYIFVKNTYEVTPIEFNIVRPQGVEDVWVAVQCWKFPAVIVGCLYWHPKSHSYTYDYINDVINSVSLKINRFIF